MATKKRNQITFEKGSGNVFADLGFANPEREQLKAELAGLEAQMAVYLKELGYD